jgi:hypothetical protein
VRRLAAAAAISFVVLFAAPARAELIRITPQGMTPAEYQAAGLPLDPAIIASTGFRLTYWGGGQDYLLNPVEIIIGVPGSGDIGGPTLTPGASGGVTMPVATVTPGGANQYGGEWNVSSGYAGTFNASSNPSTVYDFIGFTPPGSNSQSYTNWSTQSGLTSWSLYVYSVTFTPEMMNHGDWAEFTTNLPTGSYVIGYGQTSATKNNPSTGESTPFTFAGLVQTVPEPSSLVLNLSGAGLVLGFAAVARRRKANEIS